MSIKLKYKIGKERLKQRIKKTIQNIKNSKTLLAIVMLAIGISYTTIYYEGMALITEYQSAISFMGEYNERKLTSNKIEIVSNVQASEPVEIASEVKIEPIESILDGVYRLESSAGKNDDKCHRVGGHNGYGFAQGVGRNYCLGSDNEVRAKVKVWFEDKMAKYSLKQSLCIYNVGTVTENCEYVSKFESL